MRSTSVRVFALVTAPTVLFVAVTLMPTPAGAHHHDRPAAPPSAPAGVPLSTSTETAVDVQGLQFLPRVVSVHAGDTVTWTHQDSQLGHHMAAHDGSFDSHPTCGRPFGVCMKGGQTFSYTFLRAGAYGYHCRLHPEMVGTVNVLE